MILLTGASSGSSTGTRLFSVESNTVTFRVAISVVVDPPFLQLVDVFRQALLAFPAEIPAVDLRQQARTRSKVQVLGVRVARAVHLRDHHAQQIAVFVVHGTAAVAGTDRRGDLHDVGRQPRYHAVSDG